MAEAVRLGPSFIRTAGRGHTSQPSLGQPRRAGPTASYWIGTGLLAAGASGGLVCSYAVERDADRGRVGPEADVGVHRRTPGRRSPRPRFARWPLLTLKPTFGGDRRFNAGTRALYTS